MQKETIILSVGGSLIVPDTIDVDFLSHFKKFILTNVDFGRRFVIITGGGKTARHYQRAAKAVSPSLTSHDVDWIGIHSTRLNGELMKAVFDGDVHPRVIANPHEPIDFKENVLIAAGYEPGCSTDYDAVLLAKALGIKTMVNLSNIDFVYTKDPKTNPDARKIESTTWKEFRKIIPDHWDPGLNSPFDPIAARECDALGMEVVVMNGKKLDQLQNFLDKKPFEGTVIRNS